MRLTTIPSTTSVEVNDDGVTGNLETRKGSDAFADMDALVLHPMDMSAFSELDLGILRMGILDADWRGGFQVFVALTLELRIVAAQGSPSAQQGSECGIV